MSRPRISKAALAFLAFLAFFAMVSLLESSGISHDADVAVLQVVGTWRTPGLTSILQQISNVGNWQWEVPIAAAVSILLWVRGRPTAAWRFFAMCLTGEALYGVAKLLFHRARPTVLTHLSDAGWYSYPSGHSMLAPIIWGAGLILVSKLTESRAIKAACWGIAIAITVAIAVSRVYLGVHYPTDVIGGLTLGMAWVMLWWNAMKDGSRG